MTTTATTHGALVEGPAVPAISTRGLVKSFGAVHAVRGLDLDIEPGEMVAFLGPNGAGKTTTIDMILGLSDPTAGKVRVFGVSPRAAIGRGLVSAVMQTGALLKDIQRSRIEPIGRQMYLLRARKVNESDVGEGVGTVLATALGEPPLVRGTDVQQHPSTLLCRQLRRG